MLENAGISFKDIDGIIIAGLFGLYIDYYNVLNIRMFPMVSQENITQVANSAGVGIFILSGIILIYIQAAIAFQLQTFHQPFH